jgi:energy-coupling factor transport system substrate-specific component
MLRQWSTRDLMVLAALSIAIGLVLLIVIAAENVALAALGPYAMPLSIGPYGLLALLPMAVLRRPGAAALAGLIAGLVWFPFAGGLIALLSGGLVGVGCEAPFLATRYRRFGVRMFMVAAVFCALVLAALFYGPLGLSSLSPLIQSVLFLATAAVAALVGGWLSVALAQALMRTGVLAGYRAAQEI